MTKVVTVKNLRNNFSMGIVDKLPLVQPLINASLSWAMGVKKINRHLGKFQDVQDFAFVEGLMEDMRIQYEIDEQEFASLPKKGRVIVASNHPTGIMELALFNLLAKRRRDLRIVINTTLLDIAANAKGLTIPIPIFIGSNPEKKKQVRQAIQEALEHEMMLLILPAGVISNRTKEGRIEDVEWKKGLIHAARSTETPIIPAYVHAQNTSFFYWLRSLGGVGEMLSWLTLFREYLRHQASTYAVSFGEPISPDVFLPNQTLSKEKLHDLAQMVRGKVYELAK